MKTEQIVFSGHAIRRMFERAISKSDVLQVIANSEIIADYPDDTPFPSCLLLSFIRNNPVHVVVGLDRENNTSIVITVYIPDSALWTEDFKSRRK